MRLLRLALPPLALVAAVVVPPTGHAVAHPAPPSQPASSSSTHHPSAAVAQRFGADSAAHMLIRRGAGQAIRFLGTTPEHALARGRGVGATTPPGRAAAAFVAQHAADFGVSSRADTVRAVHTQRAVGGGDIVTLQQSINGVPVLGGELSLSLTDDNRVQAVSAHALPGQPALGTARLSPAAARRIALTATQRAQGLARTRLVALRPHLTVFSPTVLDVPSLTTSPRLAYRVDVMGGPQGGDPVHELVLVDATSGVVLIKSNQVTYGAVQRLCTAKRRDSVTNPRCPPTGALHQPWLLSTTSGDNDATNAKTYAQTTYNFYANDVGNATKIGVSVNGNRGLYSTVHFCDPDRHTVTPCPNYGNAFWDGHEMVYGQGMAGADDVVAHELTHSVTQHTSNLFYWYQSGAINESISDTMGELVDQWDGRGMDGNYPGTSVSVRWMIGENLPHAVGILRDMADPTRRPAGIPTSVLANFTRQPDKMTSTLYYGVQTGSAKTLVPGFPDDQGGVHINSGVGNKAAYLIVDGSGNERGGAFNGVVVPGLSGGLSTRIKKAAKIYFRVDQMLPSGADYADLFNLLPAACNALVGTAGITSDDCTTVVDAVTATEMNKPPTTAAPAEAPSCAPHAQYTEWFDNLENTTSGRWSLPPTRGKGPWYYPASKNLYRTPMVYAASGRNEAWGDDPDPQYWASRGVTIPLDGSFSMRSGFKVPTGRTTYLSFAHAFQFEWYPLRSGVGPLYMDGGKVEYSTDAGKTWHGVSSTWFAAGTGYNADITGYNATTTRQIYSFRGFGGDSHGYGTSRLNLKSLAGHYVRLRFHLRADKAVGALGWFVDDVRFYTCDLPTRPATATELPIGPGSVTVRWEAPGDPGTSAITSYHVTLKSGTTVVANQTVTDLGNLSATFNNLATTWPTLTAYVAATNSHGTGPARATNTLAGTTQTLTQAAGTAPGTTKLSGVLKTIAGAVVSGKTVNLESSPDGTTWTDAGATATTATDGSYTFDNLAPLTQTYYRVRFDGFAPGYAGSYSPAQQVNPL